MTEPVWLDELGRRSETRRLDAAQADALRATGLVGMTPAGTHRWRLTGRGKVGAVRIGALDVQVCPKIGIRRLLFMLGYSKKARFLTDDASGISEADLWPAFGESLARQAERALAGGLLHGYVPVDATLSVVRGQVRITDQVATRPGVLLPLEVRYDDYAVDIAENQLLRAAVRAMAEVPRLDPALRIRLDALDRRLEGVRPLAAAGGLPAWVPSRLNAHYVPALRLAEMVLQHRSTESGPDGLSVAAFVLPMDKLFEEFVAVALEEALAGSRGRCEAQYESYLDQQETIRIRPDVVYFAGGEVKVVCDAKYKVESSAGGFTPAEAHQILAYCTALGARVGYLVYAHGDRAREPRRVRNTSIDIVYYPLRLDADPERVLETVRLLAERVVAEGS